MNGRRDEFRNPRAAGTNQRRRGTNPRAMRRLPLPGAHAHDRRNVQYGRVSMSRWDVERARTKGATGAALPRCSRCGEPRVLNPCRDCATPAELASTRTANSRGESIEVPNYPPISPITSTPEKSL